MSQTHDRIPPQLRVFIESQRMFFVATAPMSTDGHINLSPEGLDTFRVIDEQIRREGPAALEHYRRKKNARSIDGMPTPYGKQYD